MTLLFKVVAANGRSWLAAECKPSRLQAAAVTRPILPVSRGEGQIDETTYYALLALASSANTGRVCDMC